MIQLTSLDLEFPKMKRKYIRISKKRESTMIQMKNLYETIKKELVRKGEQNKYEQSLQRQKEKERLWIKRSQRWTIG